MAKKRFGARGILLVGVLLCGIAFWFYSQRDDEYQATRAPDRPQQAAESAAPELPQEPEPSAAPSAPSALPNAAQLIQQAQAFRAAEQWDQAISTLQAAIRSSAYDEDLNYTLGSWMELHSAPDALISYWSNEVETDPKPQTAYYYWAAGLERSGDDAGALAKLGQALQVDPAHELSELHIAHILEREGKHAEALTHCLNATHIFPDFRAAHEFCAQVLQALGRAADANRELALAQSSDPHTPKRFLYWARYLAEKGRVAAARDELQRALAQNPNDAEARALQKRLGGSLPPTLGAAPSAGSAKPDAQ